MSRNDQDGARLLQSSGCFSAACATGVRAQAVEGAGYDQAPVRLDESELSRVARPVTPMDLLTLRDPKGVSISPDGKRSRIRRGSSRIRNKRIPFRPFCRGNRSRKPRPGTGHCGNATLG